MARSLEPVSDSMSPSLSDPPPFMLCLSLSQKLKKKTKKKTLKKNLGIQTIGMAGDEVGVGGRCLSDSNMGGAKVLLGE